MQLSSSEMGELRPQLNDDETQYLKNNMSIFNYFFKFPTMENYKIVLFICEFCPEWIPYKICSLKIRDLCDNGDDLTDEEKLYLEETERYVLSRNNVLTVEELDILRYLYFVSGGRKYIKRIKYIAGDTRQHYHIRNFVKLHA